MAIIRQMKALDVNPRMVGFHPAMSLSKLYEALGRDVEFIYAAAIWAPELVGVRAGGLIPIARQYPGTGAGHTALPDPAAESASVSSVRKVEPQLSTITRTAG